MNTLLSLTDNLQAFWNYTGFANAERGHIIMLLVGLFFYLPGSKKRSMNHCC